MVIALPVMSFLCPVSVQHIGEDPPDEDDPDVVIDNPDDEPSDEELEQ